MATENITITRLNSAHYKFSCGEYHLGNMVRSNVLKPFTFNYRDLNGEDRIINMEKASIKDSQNKVLSACRQDSTLKAKLEALIAKMEAD